MCVIEIRIELGQKVRTAVKFADVSRKPDRRWKHNATQRTRRNVFVLWAVSTIDHSRLTDVRLNSQKVISHWPLMRQLSYLADKKMKIRDNIGCS